MNLRSLAPAALALAALSLAFDPAVATGPDPGPDARSAAVEPQPAARVVVAPMPDVKYLDGPAAYRALCADCHGEGGGGDGRYAGRIGVTVPDLTALAEDGAFDRAEVRRRIGKCSMVPAKAAESWGEVLVASYGALQGQRLLDELAGHLEGLQASRPSTLLPGAASDP